MGTTIHRLGTHTMVYLRHHGEVEEMAKRTGEGECLLQGQGVQVFDHAACQVLCRVCVACCCQLRGAQGGGAAFVVLYAWQGECMCVRIHSAVWCRSYEYLFVEGLAHLDTQAVVQQRPEQSAVILQGCKRIILMMFVHCMWICVHEHQCWCLLVAACQKMPHFSSLMHGYAPLHSESRPLLMLLMSLVCCGMHSGPR